MIKFLVLSLVAAFAVSAKAAEAVEADRWTPDEPDVLNVKVGFLSPSFRLGTESRVDGVLGSEVQFEPPSVSKNFIGLGYRNLGATLKWGGRQNEDSISKYGDGSSLDFQFNLYGRKLTQQYFYQNYSGYYVLNTPSVDPAYPVDKYIQRPDLSTRHYGVNFIYNFHPEQYSRAVSFDQSGRQVRSGGAWLASLGLHNHAFSANPQLIPGGVASKYGELATLQKGDILQASLSGGGGFTWVFFEGLTISGEVLLGYGLAYENFETETHYYRRTAGSLNSNVNLSFGYNGRDNYVFMQVGADNYTYDLPDLSLRATSQQASFSYGYRFREMNVPVLNTVSGWLD